MRYLTSTSCVATPARQAPRAAPPRAQSRPAPLCGPAMFSRRARSGAGPRSRGADVQGCQVTAPGHRQALAVVVAAAGSSGRGRLSPHHLFIMSVRFLGRHLRHHCWGGGRCGWHRPPPPQAIGLLDLPLHSKDTEVRKARRKGRVGGRPLTNKTPPPTPVPSFLGLSFSTRDKGRGWNRLI